MENIETIERRKKLTHDFMLKIARAKIEAYGLKDTPEEYVQKAKLNENA